MPFPTGRRHAWRGVAVSQSHRLAFVQQMRAEHDHAITRLESTNDRGRVVTEVGQLHGAPGDPRPLP
ncbi:hypothetical protein GPA27_29135, partial [Aromatoleum toluolicum]|uniref:hypothetical protein n=1 Tax=Aromatoleum toluolicum TaxID=90060 RepID=UPI001B7D2768